MAKFSLVAALAFAIVTAVATSLHLGRLVA